MAEASALSRLQNVRVAVQKRASKKSGKGIQNSAFYQQKDFLPVANEEFQKEKLTPIFNIKGAYVGEKYIEEAYLTIYDATGKEDPIVFESPTASVNISNPIQALGGKHSYMKRYLYLNALELAESDIVEEDAAAKYQKAKEQNPYRTTQRQADEFSKFYAEEQTKKLLDTYKADSLLDVPVDVIEHYIDQGRKALKNGKKN